MRHNRNPQFLKFPPFFSTSLTVSKPVEIWKLMDDKTVLCILSTKKAHLLILKYSLFFQSCLKYCQNGEEVEEILAKTSLSDKIIQDLAKRSLFRLSAFDNWSMYSNFASFVSLRCDEEIVNHKKKHILTRNYDENDFFVLYYSCALFSTFITFFLEKCN